MLRVGYFADGKWGHNAFEKLIGDKDIKIMFICVRFDSSDEQFQIYAKKHNIPLLKHKNVNSSEFIELIASYGCELMISMSFNQIFKGKIINLSKYNIINCHAGNLPFYRGRNILNWALINDEKEFGITVHYVDQGIDTGDIILQRTFPISDQDNYKTLLEIAYIECANILYEAVGLFKNGRAASISQTQIAEQGFYCGRRVAGDEVVNWNQSSREIFNFIRAVCRPGPCATTFLKGEEVKINSSFFFPDLKTYKGIPGQVLSKTMRGYLVKTQDSYIEIKEIESEVKINVGDRFEWN